MVAQTESGLGQTCEGGEADFDEGSTARGVEQRSAATRRHLAQEPAAAPRDQCHPISPPQLLLQQQLALFLSVGQAPFPFLFLYCLSCAAHSVFPQVYWMSHCNSYLLFFSMCLLSLSNPSVSCGLHLPPPTASLSLSSVAAQSVSECTKHSLRLV